jgi:transcriptional regulator with XRE-family HTH domain
LLLELKRLRTEKGLSQGALARLTGLGRTTIVRLENGQQSPHLETLQKIAKVLEVKPRDIAPELFPEPSAAEELPREVVAERLPTIRRLAHKYARNTGDIDELAGAGLEGLLQAWRKFEQDQGTPFDKWSNIYIAGRIKDEAKRLYGNPENLGFDNEPAWVRTWIDAGVYDDEEE